MEKYRGVNISFVMVLLSQLRILHVRVKLSYLVLFLFHYIIIFFGCFSALPLHTTLTVFIRPNKSAYTGCSARGGQNFGFAYNWVLLRKKSRFVGGLFLKLDEL